MARLSSAPVPGFVVPDGTDWREANRLHGEALRDLEERSAKVPPGGVVGGLIHFPVADGAAIYVVVGEYPLTVAHVPYGDGYRAPAPLIRGLIRQDVLRKLEAMREARRQQERHRGFYESLREGQVVHYYHGPGEYVRCEAIRGLNPHTGEEGIVLKPLALVGSWKEFDLPMRQRDGSVRLGYQAESIRDGRILAPHESSIFESPNFALKGGPDPSGLTPVDLSIPDMAPDQEEAARLWRMVDRAAQVLVRAEDPASAIRDAISILEGSP